MEQRKPDKAVTENIQSYFLLLCCLRTTWFSWIYKEWQNTWSTEWLQNETCLLRNKWCISFSSSFQLHISCNICLPSDWATSRAFYNLSAARTLIRYSHLFFLLFWDYASNHTCEKVKRKRNNYMGGGKKPKNKGEHSPSTPIFLDFFFLFFFFLFFSEKHAFPFASLHCWVCCLLFVNQMNFSQDGPWRLSGVSLSWVLSDESIVSFSHINSALIVRVKLKNTVVAWP